MTAEETKSPLLSADHPRTQPNEDLLSYAPFAKMIAQPVLRGSPAAGLVVGIYGEWGLGNQQSQKRVVETTTSALSTSFALGKERPDRALGSGLAITSWQE